MACVPSIPTYPQLDGWTPQAATMQTPFALRPSKRTVKTVGMNRTKDPFRLSCANGKSWFFGGGLKKVTSWKCVCNSRLQTWKVGVTTGMGIHVHALVLNGNLTK